MTLTWALVLSPVCLILLFLVPVLRRLFRRCQIEEITPEWLENFSAAIYRPMESLLADDDFEFLSRQPGFDLSLFRKLRRERLQIFRQYLDRLIVDFNRLHLAARVLTARTPKDQSELFVRLIRIKFYFTLAVLRTEFNYRLCCFGVRTLPVRTLLGHLEEMSAQLLQISSAPVAAQSAG